MPSADRSFADSRLLANAMAVFVRIGAVVVLLYWCLSIVSPFLGIVVWGVILSIALYPTHVSLSRRLGGREGWSACMLVLIAIAVVLVPTWLLADSTLAGLRGLAANIQDGAIDIPPPREGVADWPLVGDRVYGIWALAATNIQKTLNQFQPQLQTAGRQALLFAGHLAGAVLQLIFSIIVAGIMLPRAAGCYSATRNIMSRLVGSTERGRELADLSIGTIRSVMKGVLGVALIQALLAAIGLFVAAVPAAGLLSGVVLVLAIIQLPPLLVLGPIAIWYFSVAEPVPAAVFLVYAVIVSVSDTFLKAFFLGRGLETPMLVILIGAIGGAITQGIVGLFVGAVTLTLGYEIATKWMVPEDLRAESGVS